MKAQILDIPAEQYHADQVADVPTLSRSIAHKLLARTPLHAWYDHPRLNPGHQAKHSGTLDHGSAAHALLFEGKQPEVCDFPDWRTNAAKEARDAARKAGKVPLLTKDAAVVQAMCDAITRQLDKFHPRPFTDGSAEQTIVWTEPNGAVCRVRPDFLAKDFTRLGDLKTTTNADPREWSRRRLWEDGLDIQHGLYRRGVRAVAGIDPEWEFVVVENTPPYALSVVSLDPEAVKLADQKVETAIQLWQQCLEADVWPGYPERVCYAELPPWEESRFLEKRVLTEMGEAA